MDYAPVVLIWTVLLWVSFMIVMTLTAKVLDFGLPVLSHTMWKLAILAFCVSVADVSLPLPGLAKFLILTTVFMAGACKWFEMDWRQAAFVTIVSRIVASFIGLGLMRALGL